MKTKTKTYVLLGVVLSIWGIIGYRIISALNPEIPEITEQTIMTDLKIPNSVAIDTFKIHVENRDPFLGVWSKKKIKHQKKAAVISIEWMPITYHGAIEKKGRPSIFIVSINNVQHLLKKGQTKDEITLLSGNAKRVILRFKNQRKSFSLSK